MSHVEKEGLRPSSPTSLLPVRPGPNHDEHVTKAKRKTPIPNACQACRKRKTKCSGERPKCMSCVRRSVVCEYAAQPTESHVQAIKRKYDVLLQQEKQMLACSELIEHLRSTTPDESTSIIARLRAGQDVKEIVDEIQTGNLLLQLRVVPETRLRYSLPYTTQMPNFLLETRSSYFDAPLYPASGSECISIGGHKESPTHHSRFLKPYHAATLAEPRLSNIKPSLWTTVTRDDDLMRDLLAAYFTREYHMYPVFQKDCFLEDMANRSTNCCSSLLVNIVLAYACYCSSKIPTRYAYWNPQGLSYQFLAEGKRILELHILKEQHRGLPTVQALMMINVYYNACGLELLGNGYGSRGLELALELRLFDDNSHISSERLRIASDFSAWAIFNMDTHNAIHLLRKPGLMRQPTVPLPNPILHPEWYGEIWLTYPLDHDLIPSHYGLFFMALSQFRVIINSICHVSFGGSSDITSTQARMFGERLFEWYDVLPEVLTPKFIFLPCHFFLHFEFNTAILMLYQPFRGLTWDNGVSVESKIKEAEQNLGILARIYYIRHSFEMTDLYLLDVFSKLGFMCLQHFKQDRESAEQENFRSTISLVLQGLWEQGQHANLIRNVYFLIKKLTPPAELRLIKHSEALQDRQNVGEEEEYIKGEIQTGWDPSVNSVLDNVTAKGLTFLIQKIDS